MIGFLKGKVVEVTGDHALIDVGGVGYEILGSSNTLGDLQNLLGQDILLWIHTHVREDALQLFGFHDKDEKLLFLSLLKVNGVGPKMALSLLSGGRPQQILDMIESGNAKALSSLPKVGKKTAEQIILTLKGKLVLMDTPSSPKRALVNHPEIASALLNLGFKSVAVEQFVATLAQDTKIEDGIRRGLAALSGPL